MRLKSARELADMTEAELDRYYAVLDAEQEARDLEAEDPQVPDALMEWEAGA